MHNPIYGIIICLILLVSSFSSASHLAAEGTESVERIICRDERTGTVMWQVSNHDSVSSMPYFETQAFTHNDEYAVFKSLREGGWKLYRTHLETGRVEKINNRIVTGGFTINPAKGDEVIFMSEGDIYAVNVENRTEALLANLLQSVIGENLNFYGSVTLDGNYTTATTHEKGKGVHIYRIHFPTRKVELAHTDPEKATHPQINPTDPNLITYSPPDNQNDYSRSLEDRARSRLIYIKEKRVVPFVMTPENCRATHATWQKDGERFFFFKKYFKPDAMGKGREVYVCSINKEGRDLQHHYVNNLLKIGHGIASNDGKWFISDVQEPHENPLYLINLETSEARIICWPNATQGLRNAQWEHVHPLFSKSGRYVAFTSDRNTRGIPQAFVVPIQDFITETLK